MTTCPAPAVTQPMRSPAQGAKTLTLDSLVRSIFGVLQVIFFAVLGWIVNAILTQQDRITRIEVRYEALGATLADTATVLRRIDETQQRLLQTVVELQTKLNR